MTEKFILLVEDNPDDEILTLRALKKNNLVNKIEVVRDGAEALDFANGRGKFSERDVSYLPELILLDIQLPKVSGLEVLKRLREDDCYKHVPIVMMTTSTQESDMVKSYEDGANSYINKPVDYNEFFEVVGKAGVYWLAINKTPRNCK